MLNIIWGLLFFMGFLVALIHPWINPASTIQIWDALSESLFSTSKAAFEVTLGLVGPMCLWLGFMRVAEVSGLMKKISHMFTPVFRGLFPEIPKDHPAISAMTLNISANMLGLDNAATPFGLRAMKELQTLNPKPQIATDAQILFLVINTGSVTLIPLGVMTQLHQLGMPNPSVIILPTLIASIGANLAGIALALSFRRGLRRKEYFTPFLILTAFSAIVAAIVAFLAMTMDAAMLTQRARVFGSASLVVGVIGILAYGLFRKISIYEEFVEGAKEGFQMILTILPYLVAMLAAIGIFKTSGAMDILLSPFNGFSFRDALPTALMRPFSGSGARGLMIETIQRLGVDALASKMVAIVQGSSETTLYVITLYFGSVGIRKYRHALWCGLFSDLVAAVLSIWVAQWFF